jgi:hypothetical protein
MNNEVINDEPLSLYSVITYVSENIKGLTLLVLAIFIIIFVDYISRINTILFSITPHIALPNVIPGGLQQIQVNKPQKMRKFRKH